MNTKIYALQNQLQFITPIAVIESQLFQLKQEHAGLEGRITELKMQLGTKQTESQSQLNKIKSSERALDQLNAKSLQLQSEIGELDRLLSYPFNQHHRAWAEPQRIALLHQLMLNQNERGRHHSLLAEMTMANHRLNPEVQILTARLNEMQISFAAQTNQLSLIKEKHAKAEQHQQLLMQTRNQYHTCVQEQDQNAAEIHRLSTLINPHYQDLQQIKETKRQKANSLNAQGE